MVFFNGMKRIVEKSRRKRFNQFTFLGVFGIHRMYMGKWITGIIYLRPGHIRPSFTIQTIEALAAQPLDVQPPFIVVAERATRRSGCGRVSCDASSCKTHAFAQRAAKTCLGLQVIDPVDLLREEKDGANRRTI